MFHQSQFGSPFRQIFQNFRDRGLRTIGIFGYSHSHDSTRSSWKFCAFAWALVEEAGHADKTTKRYNKLETKSLLFFNTGVIYLEREHVVCREGEVLSPEQAKVLVRPAFVLRYDIPDSFPLRNCWTSRCQSFALRCSMCGTMASWQSLTKSSVLQRQQQ